ncbi:MAG TPA: helix-turn-helix domain-containing protein [Opitutaceae bacterium]|nr:helix-turn-helix domain-containing protein [Opitutaceae bacterium]
MQTIGERLEDARKKRGISIREAAEATKIRGEYLQKFEGNQFEIGLTDIYTRGFLRGYANYLRIPSDRLLSDYTALRGGEPRVRQPSREVYGRMDLAISSADERGEPQAESSSSESSQRPQPRFQRPGENLPKGPAVDPALVFKGGILLVGLLGLAVAIWIVKTLFGPVPGPARSPVSAASEPIETVAAAPAASVAIVALEPVRIKVVRKSDGVELYQGALQGGERREYPNVPIFLTASDLGAVELDYKGRRYPTGHTGHERIQFDFSNR